MERVEIGKRTTDGPAPAERLLVDRILRALKGIRYGAVEIVVHDSKVVQIERKEKYRLECREAFGAR
ncbi:MAG: YezD family protein [Deltaproteobacteria bacterium]|nr:YezD family protein [Deltaproteobacteria bacterium]